MKYDVKQDRLVPTDALMNGDSEIMKDIAANVRGWAGNWDAVWDNVLLRQQIKQYTVDAALTTGKQEILEAEFTVKSNNAFHQISDKVSRQEGIPKGDLVFKEWKHWFDEEVSLLA
jgi:archaeal flagellar protein FlaI